MQRLGIVLILLAIFSVARLHAQEESDVVQFSGMVLDGTTQELFPVPYVNILVVDKGRGTYSDFNGFFSIVVEKGDVIEFSAVGYKTVQYAIPDTLKDNRYSLVQLMTQDAVNLPETVVFPWPSRDHFRLEFLAMDVTPELQKTASKNTAKETLERMRNEVASDGVENSSFYLRQQSREYYYIGQRPPMNIFSPVAWKQFFDAWQRGDFKKKRN
ncbi:MAG: carboxypeptidase-like regulatory domain-containing protein [Saprospiraceae bacterium]